MTCPSCGAAAPSGAARCVACNRVLTTAPRVLAGVLTPSPVAPDARDDAETRPPDAEATYFQPPSTDAQADVTYFQPPAAGSDAAPPRDGPSAPASGNTTKLPPANDGETSGETRPQAPLPGRPAAPATGPLAVGQDFGRYHIIRVLGIGGMGAVYQAWDAELETAVALKVIRPETTRGPAAEREMERRFKQELMLARQVTHKNVVRIHDLGELGGIKYITMPYLKGQDLATLMKQRDRMPVDEALRIIRDVAAGLVAAHEAGVVHRDLKPANIMVLSDRAVIMDFGIARSAAVPEPPVERPSGEAAVPGAPASSPPEATWMTSAATVVGTILGTVQYMAPEQAKGQPADQRADIYAVGLMALDMLLGRRQGPRVGDGPMAELTWRVDHAPPRAQLTDPAIPDGLDELIARCVQPVPADRFQTSAELVAALDRLDERGKAIPVRKVVGLPLAAAVVAGLLALAAGTVWYQQQLIPPVAHAPVSVVIADLQNRTGEAALDRTLEPMMKLALEQASFVSAHARADIRRNLGVQVPESLDETAAREIAVKQGLGVVLSGSVARDDAGYALELQASEAVSGKAITTVQDRARSQAQVLTVASRMVERVRTALGDDASDSAKRFAMDTLSATSLDVVRRYAVAMEAASAGDFRGARDNFSAAVSVDPNFGLAYTGMAMMSRNLGQQQDAERYAKEALRHLDRMTERERYRTRGMAFTVSGDYQACVKEYGDLTARFGSDTAARNNLALCYTYLRNMKGALTEMRRVVEILPKRALYRVNLGLYAAYAGDFTTAAEEGQASQGLGSPLGLLPLAFAQLGQGQLADAAASYQSLGTVGPTGASYAASGLADLAAYEGRYADAQRLLIDGIASDLASTETDRAAAKLVALASVHLARGQRTAAAAAARQALGRSQAVKIRFLAAQVLADAGETDGAKALAAGLAGELQPGPQAYGKIIEGTLALLAGDSRQAIRVLGEANMLLDTWIGRFHLGRAYLAEGAFTQADAEFDRCLARRGEALSLFLDEEPTYGSLPPVYYYQGRVREGLGSAGAAESFRTYVSIRGGSGEDPLLADARRRAGR